MKMERKWLTRAVTAAVLAVSASYSCGDSTGPNQDQLTEEQRQRIQNAYQIIAATADSILLLDDPHQSFELMVPTYREVPDVEGVSLSDRALFVKYQHGGLMSWYISLPRSPMPLSSSEPGKFLQLETQPLPAGEFGQLMDPVGNKRALLVNQTSQDEKFSYYESFQDSMARTLRASGFDVPSPTEGKNMSLEFLGSELRNYGLVIIATHGSTGSAGLEIPDLTPVPLHWILTGEPGCLDERCREAMFYSLFGELLSDWRNDRIKWVTNTEERDRTEVTVNYYAISQRFIEDRYSAGDFPNSLIYINACQTFKGGNEMGEVFASKGAAVTLGWTHSQCIGDLTGALLIDYMVAGLDVQSAIGKLRWNERYDDGSRCNEPPKETRLAELTYHPLAGGSTTLGEGIGHLQITGGTYSDRDRGLVGTSFVFNPNHEIGAISSVPIRGPAGWNDDQPLTCELHQPPGIADHRSICGPLVPAITGEYAASATVDDRAFYEWFSIDAADQLAAPRVTNLAATSEGLLFEWEAAAESKSFLLAVCPDLPGPCYPDDYLGEILVPGDSRHASVTGLSLDPGTYYVAGVVAMSHDFVTPGDMTGQFNASGHWVEFESALPFSIAGGTWYDRDAGLMGSAFVFNPNHVVGTISSVDIRGPEGWNDNAPLTCGLWQPPGTAGDRSLCGPRVPAVSGEYMAEASADGQRLETRFSIDLNDQLGTPEITGVTLTANEVALEWNAPPESKSFLARVARSPFEGDLADVLQEVVVGGDVRQATLSEVSLDTGTEYVAEVVALALDVVSPGEIEGQFNSSTHFMTFRLDAAGRTAVTYTGTVREAGARARSTTW
jgi:hypothetical protein